MRFIHIADMHFDIPFSSLNEKKDLAEKRRLEQRDTFSKIIKFIQDEEIEYLFISGDLYEHEYVRESTVEFINNSFKQIPNTKVFISPGNHDPYMKDSYYYRFEFADNVYVFRNSRIEKYEDENVNIFGMAFNEFYLNNSPLENLSIPYSSKPNILVAHLDLNGVKDKNDLSYNPISESKLNNMGFDYCAIGHIHKNNLDNKNKIYYPGSTISLGFDELGEHGMIVGEITKDCFNMEFVKLDDRIFKEEKIDISEIYSKEELVEYIKSFNYENNNLYKIILIGKRNFDINTRELLRLVDLENVLKIKDTTKVNYDIEKIANQNNLKGFFVKELLEKYNSGLCSEEEFEKALEIGLNAM